jgi:hypothetical protein
MPEIGNKYLVGYRKPPKQTQFRKGQSGNPRGRPKQKVSIQMLIAKELRRHLTFNENGKRASDSKLSLMVKQVVNKAVAGDFHPFMHLGKLQTWLQAIDNESTVRIIESTMSEKESKKLYEEMLRSGWESSGLK